MAISTDSDNGEMPRAKLFGRERPIHAAIGGGKVADVLLWRDSRTSGVILFAVGVVWFLFEVVEYSFITLLCHIFITVMLLIFIWSTGAGILKWSPPKIPEIILKDSTLREVVLTIPGILNGFKEDLLFVACGNDPKLFIVLIASLWILSLIGNYISTVNLLFLGLICMETLPFLYEKYEVQVDDLAWKLTRRMRRMYKNLEANVLGKIPREKDEKFA